MKYRVFALLGILALSAGSLIQAQDYDDIYYDASKSTTGTKTTKTTKATADRTQAVYGLVPERYSVAASSNYRVERDDDEYNRRGAYDPDSIEYEVDINGDTIFEEAFANTRRIERFYNPDIVILSDDDELVELYYDESPTINLIVGSDWGYGYRASYAWADSFYPWYTGWYPYGYHNWYLSRWYDPWYSPYYGYYSPYWHWGWHYSPWYRTGWGWDYAWHGWYHPNYWHNWSGTSTARPSRPGYGRPAGVNPDGTRVGLATNRNGRSRVGMDAGNRNGISPRGGDGNRATGVGGTTTRSRGGYATGRGGNMGSRSSSGVSSRGGGVSRSSSTGTRSTGVYSGGSRSSSGYSGGSRSSGGSYSGGSRSSGGSYSGSSHSSGGSYSGGGSRSGGSSGGGSHGGSSGGGGRRR
jgi:hypothetical protein